MVVISTAIEQWTWKFATLKGSFLLGRLGWTHISPPLLCSHACFLSIVGICLGLVLECFFEGLRYVVVAEASEPERSCDFAVLLSHRLARGEEGAKGIETDEQVLFGHDLDEQGG
jgi:hypothetical protein